MDFETETEIWKTIDNQNMTEKTTDNLTEKTVERNLNGKKILSWSRDLKSIAFLTETETWKTVDNRKMTKQLTIKKTIDRNKIDRKINDKRIV